MPKKTIRRRGKKVSVSYDWGEHRFFAHSAGYENNSNPGYAYFVLDESTYKLYGNRGLNFCLFSKIENRIIDLFSVDTNADEHLNINRYTENAILKAIDLSDCIERIEVPHNVLISFFKDPTNIKQYAESLDRLIKIIKVNSRENLTDKRKLIDLLKIRNTETDQREVFEILQFLSKMEDLDAIESLGKAYRDGKGVEKNQDKAIECMREAFKGGILQAGNMLFDLLWKRNNSEDLAEMKNVAEYLAKRGDGNAKLRLGRIRNSQMMSYKGVATFF